MTRFDIRPFAALTLLAALIAAPVSAGTETEIEVTDHRRDKIGTMRILVEGLDLRIEQPALTRKTSDQVMIFRGERANPRMIFLMGDSEHFVVDRAGLAKVMESQAQPEEGRVMSPEAIERAWKTAERIADPDARARALADLEKRYGPREGEVAAAPIEWVQGAVREKEGYPCVRYDALRGGEKIATVWVTDWANLEGGRQTGQALIALQEFQRELSKLTAESTSTGPGIPKGVGESSAPDLFDYAEGFPVILEEYENGELVKSSVLKSSRKAEPAPGSFKPGAESVESRFGG